MKGSSIQLVIIFIVSLVISYFVSGYDTDIINYSTVLNSLISIFAVSFAIVAIMFTILNRYKEKVDDPKLILEKTQSILPELIDDTVGLFALIVTLFAPSLAKNAEDN